MQYREPTMAQGAFYTFWFEKNLQGDVVAVYNETGTKLISYAYDAWGNFRTTTHNHSGTNAYAAYNPFRYRGYYYDDFYGCLDDGYGRAIGFYYLNSRYYNPEWGRFINADGYVSTGTGLLGYNMFAYCNNNPVMYVDPDGEFPFLILAIVAVVAVTALTMTSCTPISNDVDDNYEVTSKCKYKYDTYEEAVMAAAKHIEKDTMGYGNEYEFGTYIFQYPDDPAYYYNGTSTSLAYNYVQIPNPIGKVNIVAVMHSHCNDNLAEPYGADMLGQYNGNRIDSFIVIPSAVNRDKNGLKIYCLPYNATQLDQFHIYYP